MISTNFIPTSLKLWFFISALIVFFDASFVLQRPASLKGGQLYKYYFAYDNYIIYDTLYASLTDTFVIIQSWLNIVEGVLLITAVLMSFSSSVSTKLWSALISVITSTCVLWKTVIFVWYDHQWSTQAAKNFTPGSILCYWFPNSLWLVFPLIAIILISGRIVSYVNSQNNFTPQGNSKTKVL